MLAGTQPIHKPCPKPAEALRLIEILRLSVLCLQSTSSHSDFSAVTLLNANFRISTVVSRPSLALLFAPQVEMPIRYTARAKKFVPAETSFSHGADSNQFLYANFHARLKQASSSVNSCDRS